MSYRIANIVVNPQLSTIQNERVEPKVMQLLGFLVQYQGQVCSKQDILNEIWPRQVVADDVVTRLIFNLRGALGDDAKSPLFISTIPKKGYVFLVKAKPVPLISSNKKAITIIIGCCLLLGVMLTWYNWPESTHMSNYEVQRSLPITHQEGREYSYVTGEHFTGYFHEHDNLTKLVISEENHAHKVLIEDQWQKRSLIVVDELLLYIRFRDNNYQIIQQTLNGEWVVLFDTHTPIYSLSFDDETQTLLFNHYQNNDSVVLYSYSFMSKKVTPLVFENVTIPNKIYSPYYQVPQNILFFVGIEGRKPIIYGLKRKRDSYQYQINGFDKVTSLSQGKTTDELLVVGTYQFIQGIWSVSLKTGAKSIIFSHPDNDITQAYLSTKKHALYYSFQGQRVDLKEVSLQGKQNNLPKLNSTLVDKAARYSPDGKEIYFTSNRSGDYELYSYHKSTSLIRKISNLKATTIWHYSFSNDYSKVALVYSTDHIRLGVLDLASGKITNSTPLDEIKFPLGWSKDDKHIYISEHLSNITMYLYDAEKLVIKRKRPHIGLTAFELNTGEIVAFDYQTMRFVAYNFQTEQLTAMSEPVQEYMNLAPYNTYTNGKEVMLLYKEGMQKNVYRLLLSKIKSERRVTLVANLLQTGNMQAFSPNMSALLIADKDKSLNGNITSLQLK